MNIEDDEDDGVVEDIIDEEAGSRKMPKVFQNKNSKALLQKQTSMINIETLKGY